VKHLVWPDRGCGCGCEQRARFPAVTLPDEATLAKLVATDGAGLLRPLAALATWAGEPGKTVDSHGEPRKADQPALLTALGLSTGDKRPRGGPALARLWRLAIEFDVVQLRRARVVPGVGAGLVAAALAGECTPEQALGLWSDLADALIHPPTPPTTPKGSERLRDWLRPWMPRFLGILYAATADGESADLDTVTEQLLHEFADRLPPGDPDLFAGIAVTAVRDTLFSLVRHGAAVITGASDDPDPREAAVAAVLGTAAWAWNAQPGLTVDLTDLGRYLVRQRLIEGAHAPLAE
jgi:hypothetical protein